jgi:tetratricopeptide (TPR) repeat protein
MKRRTHSPPSAAFTLAMIVSPLLADPIDLHALDRQARALTSRRFTDEAQVRRFEETIAEMKRLFPNEPASLYWQGLLLDRAHQSAEGATLWKQSLEANSSSTDSRSKVWRADAATLLGAHELGLGNGEEGAKLAEQAIAAHPQKIEAYRLLIDASFQLGDLARAERTLREQTADLATVPSELMMCRFALLADQGKWTDIDALVRSRRKHRPFCPAALYFAARLADRDQQADRAAVLMVLASLNGSPRSESGLRSDEWISRRAYERLAHPEQAPRDVLWVHDIVARYEIGQRRGLPVDGSERAAAILAAESFPATSPEQQTARQHLLATLELWEGKLDSAGRRWRSLSVDQPEIVPAWCRLAELEEVDPDPVTQARAPASWQRGADLEPNHPLVRDRIRLGIEVKSVAEGVKIQRVERFSPAEEIGWNTGDILQQISRQNLTKIPTIERLRLVRLFSGGEVVWLDPTGTPQEQDVPLLLLE